MLVFKSRVVVTLGLISLGTQARGKPRWEKSVKFTFHRNLFYGSREMHFDESEKYFLMNQRNTFSSAKIVTDARDKPHLIFFYFLETD